MTRPCAARRVLVLTVAVTMSACDSSSGPSSPTAVPPQVPLTPREVAFTVTDGWTGVAVEGATVSTDTATEVSDASGQVIFTQRSGPCLVLSVVAKGFLPR